MSGASGALIVVYVLAVLFLLASVGYGYVAWRNYRRAMRDALQRRRERHTERVTQDNYWIGDPPPPSASIHATPHAVAVRVHSPSSKVAGNAARSSASLSATPLRSHRAGGL